MKSQVGRYTVVHESKAFPYLRFNVNPAIVDGEEVPEIQAFIKRVEFWEIHSSVLRSRGVSLSSDAGLLGVADEDADFVRALFAAFEDLCRYWGEA